MPETVEVLRAALAIELEDYQGQELLAHFGSVAAASRAIGVPRTTLAYWLNPEPHRDRQRQQYNNDYDWRERKLSQQLRRKRELMDQGLCSDCGEPGLSEWYCFICLGKRSRWG